MMNFMYLSDSEWGRPARGQAITGINASLCEVKRPGRRDSIPFGAETCDNVLVIDFDSGVTAGGDPFKQQMGPFSVTGVTSGILAASEHLAPSAGVSLGATGAGVAVVLCGAASAYGIWPRQQIAPRFTRNAALLELAQSSACAVGSVDPYVTIFLTVVSQLFESHTVTALARRVTSALATRAEASLDGIPAESEDGLAMIRAAEVAEAAEQRKLRDGIEEAYAGERAVWDFLPDE
jgi:hypothetical protein